MNILLNLLPEERKEILKENVRSRFVLSQVFFYFFLEIFYLGILIGALFIVKFEQENVSIGIESHEDSDRKKITEMEKSFRDVNERTTLVLKGQSDHLYWTRFLLLLQKKFPQGVALSDLSTKEYHVTLSGEADIRDHLLEFESRLKSESCFLDVNVPIANLVSRQDISFQIEFDLRKDCIRENL